MGKNVFTSIIQRIRWTSFSSEWCITGKEHLERNDFIIEKQKAELQRMDAAKRHKEEQIGLAEQELRQVKSEIRTDKLKSAATDAATAIASGVASLFGSGKLKELEHANEKLKDEEISRLNAILEKAFNWFPLLKEMLRMERLCYAISL